jgi:uncharacterized protein YbcI
VAIRVTLKSLEEPNVHHDDASELRESETTASGPLRDDISREIVGLYKLHRGKGPVHCRTYLEPNLVIVVLGDGYSAAEQTLFEGGKWYQVRRARQEWQDTMQVRFIEVIERLTERTVSAFMSANHQDPDLAVELFVLEGEEPG